MKTVKRITALVAIVSFFAFQGFSQNASTSDVKKDVESLCCTI